MDMKLIKKLREETGAGMLECKKALEESNDNYEDAINYLKEHMTHQSQNHRVASKGLTKVVIKDDDAILFEVNAETDFAAKNPHFIEMLDRLSQIFILSSAKNVKEAALLQIDDKNVNEYIQYVSGLMKENLELRRFHRIKKQKIQSFGHYMHGQGKLSVLVIFDQECQAIAKEIAMIIASHQPSYISIERLDSDTLNYEKFLYEKNSDGFKSFDEFINSKLLINLPSIYDGNLNVKELLEKHHTNIIDFYRFELGQGIEDKLNCRLDIPCDGSKITVTPIY